MEGCPLRRHIDHPVSSFIRPALFFLSLQNPAFRLQISIVNRLRLHQHPGAAPIGIIIYFFMLIPRIIPDIQGFNTDMPCRPGTSDNAFSKPPEHHLRKECQNMEICHRPPLISVMILLFPRAAPPPAVLPSHALSYVRFPDRPP